MEELIKRHFRDNKALSATIDDDLVELFDKYAVIHVGKDTIAKRGEKHVRAKETVYDFLQLSARLVVDGDYLLQEHTPVKIHATLSYPLSLKGSDEISEITDAIRSCGLTEQR